MGKCTSTECSAANESVRTQKNLQSPEQTQTQPIQQTERKPFPGVENLGKGYNVFTGNPFAARDKGLTNRRILKLEYGGLARSVTGDDNVKVPRAVRLDPQASGCQMNKEDREITSVKGFQREWDKKIGLSAQALYGVRGGASVQWKEINGDTKGNQFVYSQTIIECTTAEAFFQMEQKPLVHPDFAAAVRALPLPTQNMELSIDGQKTYGKFMNNWGTHVITNIELGGRFQKMYKFTQQEYSQLVESGWKVKGKLGVGIMGTGGDIGGSYGKSKRDIDTIQNAVKSTNGVTQGGDFNTDPNVWATSIRQHPIAVKIIKPVPIQNFISMEWIPDGSAGTAQELQLKAAYIKDGLPRYCWAKTLVPNCEAPQEVHYEPPMPELGDWMAGSGVIVRTMQNVGKEVFLGEGSDPPYPKNILTVLDPDSGDGKLQTRQVLIFEFDDREDPENPHYKIRLQCPQNSGYLSVKDVRYGNRIHLVQRATSPKQWWRLYPNAPTSEMSESMKKNFKGYVLENLCSECAGAGKHTYLVYSSHGHVNLYASPSRLSIKDFYDATPDLGPSNNDAYQHFKFTFPPRTSNCDEHLAVSQAGHGDLHVAPTMLVASALLLILFVLYKLFPRRKYQPELTKLLAEDEI